MDPILINPQCSPKTRVSSAPVHSYFRSWFSISPRFNKKKLWRLQLLILSARIYIYIYCKYSRYIFIAINRDMRLILFPRLLAINRDKKNPQEDHNDRISHLSWCDFQHYALYALRTTTHYAQPTHVSLWMGLRLFLLRPWFCLLRIQSYFYAYFKPRQLWDLFSSKPIFLESCVWYVDIYVSIYLYDFSTTVYSSIHPVPLLPGCTADCSLHTLMCCTHRRTYTYKVDTAD